MRLEDLDYELPERLIAQRPADRREAARLLVVERASGALTDARIVDLPRWLRAGDALAINETRVVPARLHVRRPTGGRIELLFVRPDLHGAWRVLARPASKAGVGAELTSEDGGLDLQVIAVGDGGERVVTIVRGDLKTTLEAHGEVPLPPYIHRPADDADRERYQTVYARVAGAVAAPTAGLHFSPELLQGLEQQGVPRVPVVLHVGPGTFRPITSADPTEHRMDEEWFEVGEPAVARLRAARESGGRIVAVGTTVVRALESACDMNGGALAAARGWTRKFIVPPYTFRAVDALLTNFHLPRTTLLLLVASLLGPEQLQRAYAHAVSAGYRFYSYGDAMLVV